MPGGTTFREHSGSLKRAGNSFSLEEARILEAVFESMLHGKLNEQIIRGYVRQHPALLLGLAKKGRKMAAAIRLMQGEDAEERRALAFEEKLRRLHDEQPPATGKMAESVIEEALRAS